MKQVTVDTRTVTGTIKAIEWSGPEEVAITVLTDIGPITLYRLPIDLAFDINDRVEIQFTASVKKLAF